MAGVIAIVVAAGRGTRAGGDRPKQYVPVAGQPLLRHTLAHLAAHPRIDAILPVIHPKDRETFAAVAEGIDVLTPVDGGASRQDSVHRGLEALADRDPDAVLIHDGARPFPDTALIDRVLAALDTQAGAIPALPVSDTLKRAEDRRIVETVPRGDLWRAQTPQGFRYPEILDAHRAATDPSASDDAALAERAGYELTVVDGSTENIKVTTRDDIHRVERWLAGGTETRTGSGFDVHAFGDGAGPVRLCGVDVPSERGLAGHSDADVGLHVLVDALLGAIGAGDIGEHFPPSDDRWKGADSAAFVAHALELVRERGGAIVNVDITLICERPKVGPHRAPMRERVAGLLGLASERVSVKATTTEKLGFVGRREGIAAQAVATVRVPAA
ncbi:2-C-methyl-D-erythritol 2,4-cyclodiphosphate synthase [Limimonas halophila]|uniref:Bifunctional enzyme IspD/IspF n=1 Tax=Limimonas halophila TaxID=1082479 RepID=A0A1G7NC80_9PROT|nr:bifunctional 2-C-methyl-D-erythritol 4-phosphate cytidylyltransferase/2-C-methyl-D-erythritol 2,4-cyclodiphosphate synthase [Limimonas halophila]SDF71614.1 2-C-methyl-D-erythritol 2,4-cyclodiphosphate synthase [Limimonas halophila]